MTTRYQHNILLVSDLSMADRHRLHF